MDNGKYTPETERFLADLHARLSADTITGDEWFDQASDFMMGAPREDKDLFVKRLQRVLDVINPKSRSM